MTVKMWVYEGLAINFETNKIALAKTIKESDIPDGKAFKFAEASGIEHAIVVDKTDPKPFAIYFNKDLTLGYNENGFLNLFIDKREWTLEAGVVERMGELL
jgi:hypothetical protein